MATWTVKGIEIAQAPVGLQQTITLPEAASQTFKAGALVRIGIASDTGKDGKILACAGATNELVLGVANADASGVENTDCLVHLVYPGITRLRVVVTDHDGAGSAVTAASNVGKSASAINTSGIFTINGDAIGANAAYVLNIVGVCPRYTVGDAFGRYICTLKSANSQLAS